MFNVPQLPKVTMKSYEKVREELLKSGQVNFTNDVAMRMMTNNPVISKFSGMLIEMTRNVYGKKVAYEMADMAAFIYRLFEVEIDNIKEQN